MPAFRLLEQPLDERGGRHRARSLPVFRLRPRIGSQAQQVAHGAVAPGLRRLVQGRPAARGLHVHEFRDGSQPLVDALPFVTIGEVQELVQARLGRPEFLEVRLVTKMQMQRYTAAVDELPTNSSKTFPTARPKLIGPRLQLFFSSSTD